MRISDWSSDVCSSDLVVGTTLNLDIVESLPTGRTYQSYLQLVPGVKPSVDGNPSSKSGVNYSDVGGDIGISTDNVYYLDGVNVTDPLDGVAGANFTSEIIQEKQVDRKSVVEGKSVSVRVDLGGSRRSKKKNRKNTDARINIRYN